MTVFSRILVPLDGSEFSELSMSLIDAVQRVGSVLTLLRVVGEPEAAGAAEEYLRRIAASCGGDTAVLVRQSDDPAGQILEEVVSGGHDLVVLMTHGRGGLERWVRGSVAEHVVRHCHVPLLLANPLREGSLEARFRKVLVPLDGSERTDSVLEFVQPLSLALGAEVVLSSAVWVEPTSNPLAYSRDLDGASAKAKERLTATAVTLANAGVQSSLLVTVDPAAESILHAAEKTGADLIAMTTHGRTGVKRWLLGSIAERVLRASPLPVLLLRNPGNTL